MHSRPVIDSQPAQARVMLLLGYVIFLSVLNGTTFIVAIPDIAEEFSLGPSSVSWVVTAYLVLFAFGSATYGKLADIHGVRRLISVGLVLLNAGSLIGLVTPNYPMLLFARSVQAAGGAAIPALAMLIATRYFPPGLKGRVLGAAAAAVALGSGAGPILGGLIAGYFDWRYLFALPLLTLPGIPLFRRILPREPSRAAPFDYAGAFLLGTSVAFAMFAFTWPRWWLAAATLSALVLFVWQIRRTSEPFVRFELFMNHRYLSGLLSVGVGIAALMGMLFGTPLMLREHNSLVTLSIGAVFFPGAMLAAALGPFGGRLCDRAGFAPVCHAALVLLSLGLFALSVVAGQGAMIIAAMLVFVYLGFSLIQSSLAGAVSQSLPREHLGVGMGMYNLVFFTAGGAGAALSGKLLEYPIALPLNPLALNASAASFGNLYLVCALAVLASLAVFHAAFGWRDTVVPR